MKNIEYIPRYTYEDYVQWEGRWELINGIPVAMTPLPTIEHQGISGNIHAHLKQLLKDWKNCKALIPVDWKINENTVVQPDVSVICHQASGPYLKQAPKLIFEILSPSTGSKDKTVKYEIYRQQGVKYYVLVDINSNLAEVFQLKNKKYIKMQDAKNDIITFDLDECKIDFDFSDIWIV
jgi:Uma2 family endonuclease